MKKIDRGNMKQIVQNFKKQKLLVLGDLMLDKYIWGNVSRISPEAPVPVVEVKSDSLCLGGAGNVYRNLESLGAAPLLVGVVGKDDAGRWIRKNVSDNRGIFVDTKRPTTVKTRIIAYHQQIVRFDLEKKREVSEEIQTKILEFVQQERCRGLILSDYSKGMLAEGLLARILPYAEKRGMLVFVDPKVEKFGIFSTVTLMTPNHFEAERIIGRECRTDAQVERAGNEILAHSRIRYLILKRGEQGMSVFEKGEKPIHIPTIAKEVFDVTGAGDTVIAAAALALLSGATILEAACISNAAAGIVVGKIGTATVSVDELAAAIDQL